MLKKRLGLKRQKNIPKTQSLSEKGEMEGHYWQILKS